MTARPPICTALVIEVSIATEEISGATTIRCGKTPAGVPSRRRSRVRVTGTADGQGDLGRGRAAACIGYCSRRFAGRYLRNRAEQPSASRRSVGRCPSEAYAGWTEQMPPSIGFRSRFARRPLGHEAVRSDGPC